jgi:hypothetical protein
MTLRRMRESRRHDGGLLARPPFTPRELGGRWSELVVDPTRQLAVLAELLDRGLLSREEFDGLASRLALDVTAI